MQIEHIHFEEVFDVQAWRGDFSFRTQGRSCYGANFGSGIIPRVGARFALVFDSPGDWSTLVAWRDLASKQVEFRNPHPVGLPLALSDLLLFGPLLIIAGLLIAGKWIAASGFAALLAFAVTTIVVREARRRRLIEKTLLAAG